MGWSIGFDKKWLEWKLTNESWAAWRAENPLEVKKMQEELEKQVPPSLAVRLERVAGNPRSYPSPEVADLMVAAAREIQVLRVKAARWEKLIRLAGYVQDGTDRTVAIFQDDATKTCYVQVGGVSYFGADGGSFEEAIDSIKED